MIFCFLFPLFRLSTFVVCTVTYGVKWVEKLYEAGCFIDLMLCHIAILTSSQQVGILMELLHQEHLGFPEFTYMALCINLKVG